MVNITIGADPEFFLKDKYEFYVSAHDIVPGTKETPYELDGGAVQADGTAVEINVNPSKTRKEFLNNIDKVLTQVREIVPNDLEFCFEPSVVYRQAYFDSIPDESKVLGCEPDRDALNRGHFNPSPNGKSLMRTAGGHMHIGWGKDLNYEDMSHKFDCIELVKELHRKYQSVHECFELDVFRPAMYGSTAAFRPKSYGVEYRAPSNSWMRNKLLRGFMFDMCHAAFYSCLNNRSRDLILPEGDLFSNG